MGRERRDAHRDDGPLGHGQRPDGAQELLRAGPVDDAQDRVAAGRQPQRALASVFGLLVAFDEPAPDESVDQPARCRGRPSLATSPNP